MKMKNPAADRNVRGWIMGLRTRFGEVRCWPRCGCKAVYGSKGTPEIMVDDRKVALPGTWEKMTCVVEVLRPDGKWCAIPSEVIPSDIRTVLESQLILDMDESTNKEFARKLRKEHGLLQVMRMIQKPGHQCLSWVKGDLIMLPPIIPQGPMSSSSF